MNKTIEYYNENADRFVGDTQTVSMSTIQSEFLELIPVGGLILDFGCGSGRDSKVFKEAGYSVVPVDASLKMCEATQTLTGIQPICTTFQDFITDDRFDGIWACASLLHLQLEEITSVIKRVSEFIKPGGCFYMSFKYGSFSGERNGRYFTDLNEDTLINILSEVNSLSLIKTEITSDVRPRRENEKWLNCFCIKT